MALVKRTKGIRRVPGVLASFVHVDAAADAIRALRARGIRNLTVYSAAPNHELDEALEHRVSPVRLFTLIGGLTGCSAGFGMTLWMSHDWPTVVGGKPIGSIPPYVVIGFELTILLGALSTVAAVALFSVLMGRRGVPYDPRFSDDRIGIFVPAAPDLARQVEQLLRKAGAEEVRHEGA
jgi:ActD protein